MTGDYKKLQGVTKSDRGFRMVTGDYKRRQGVKKVTRGDRGLQGVTGS